VALATQCPEPLLRAGRDGTVLWANPAGAELLSAWGGRVGARLSGPAGDLVPVDGGRYVNIYGRGITGGRSTDGEIWRWREQFGAMVEDLSIGAVVISPKMELLVVNRQIREWFPEVDAAERPICYRAFSDPPRDSSCPTCPAVRTLADGRTHEAITELQRGGGVGSYRAISFPVRDAGGRTIAAVELLEEITAQRKVEERLSQSRRLELVGQLAGGVAHDFNNLLTAIKGYAELATGAVAPGSRLSEDLSQIVRAADRGAELASQLLAFGRRRPMSLVPVDVNALVRSASGMLRRLIGEHIHLDFLLGEDLWNVRADPAQLEEVFVNLLLNARDAMPDGGEITVETANVVLDESYGELRPGVVPGPHVMIAVSDIGCGIDKEIQDRIFEPFFTTKPVGIGTGLGLATVYGVVKQHGGNIYVYSEPGRGATFKIYLPSIDEPAVALEPKDAPGEMRRGTETILVVEDDNIVRQFVVRTLRSLGYTVLEAAHPQAALRLWSTHGARVHLILTDVVMPEMKGPALVQRMGAVARGVKAVYMSGYSENMLDQDELLPAGATVLQKPFSPWALAKAVREALDTL